MFGEEAHSVSTHGKHMMQRRPPTEAHARPKLPLGREQTLRAAVVLRGGAQQNQPVAQLK